jgi:hypothetical protein
VMDDDCLNGVPSADGRLKVKSKEKQTTCCEYKIISLMSVGNVKKMPDITQIKFYMMLYLAIEHFLA